MKFTALLRNLLWPATLFSIALSLAVPITLYLLPQKILRELDLNFPLPLFLIQTSISLLLIFILRNDFKKFLKSLSIPKIHLLFITLFSIAITLFAGTQIEARHRVQSDESVFLSLAQNMYHNHISGTCQQGEFENGHLNCLSNSNSFKAKGLSFLYFLGMPFLGPDLHWAFNAELCLLFLSALLFYLAILAWTKESSFSLLASVILFVQPTLLFQFRALSIEPLYIFLFSLALFLCRFASESNTWKHWALAACSIAFFAQTRQETVFALAAFIALAFPKILDKKDLKAPLFFIFLAVFSSPILITISYYQNFNFQGGEFAAHGHFFEHLVKNWNVMTGSPENKGLLSNPFLPYFNYLFLFGLIFLIGRSIREIIFKRPYRDTFFLGFLFLLSIQVYMILENVSGDFTIEINQRYSLVMFPAMAILSAYPFFIFLKFLSKKFNAPKIFLLTPLLLAIGASAYTASYKESFNENIMYKRNHLTTEEVEIWKWLKEKPLKKRLFIYARPYHFIGYGLSSIHYDKARAMSDSEWEKKLNQYEGEVYYIRGLDCWDSKTFHKKAVEHRIPTTCDHFERDMSLLGEKNILITQSYWVQIAKFFGRKNYSKEFVLMFENISRDSTSLAVNFSTKESGEHPWKISFKLSGALIFEEPYRADKFSIPLSIAEEKSKSGMLHLEILVTDTLKRDTLSKVSKFILPDSLSVQRLSELKPKTHHQEWGALGINRSIENNALTVDGETYPFGLAVHARSQTDFELNGEFESLHLRVGLDEESLCSDGATLEIYGDDKKLAEEKISYSAIPIEVSLLGVQTLSIRTLPEKSIDCDHVDLLVPILFRKQ